MSKAFENTKTLVLDLDETLISSSMIKPDSFDFSVPIVMEGIEYDVFVRKRPGCDDLLEFASKNYHLYFFTSSLPQYANTIIDILIPGFPHDRVLTRKYCDFVNGSYIKNLRHFHSSLSSIIIIDDKASSFVFNQSNGIPITSWTGDYSDTQLSNFIIPFLNDCLPMKDVRFEIAKFKQRNRHFS